MVVPSLFYIYGYYGSKNAGDEAFKLAFRSLLPSSAQLRFLRPSEMAANGHLAEQIRRDVSEGNACLIVGGGAIIGEPYFWEHIPSSTPFFIVSADIGSRDFLLSRYSPTLKQVRASWIRSEDDVLLLRKLTGGNTVQFLPDIVHSLAPGLSVAREVAQMDPDVRNLRLWELMEEQCENIMPQEQLRKKNMAVFLSDHYYDYRTIGSSNVLDGIEREALDKLFFRHLRLALDEIIQYYNLYFFSLSYWFNSIDAFVGYQLAKSSRSAPLYNLVNRYLDPRCILDLMPYFDVAISMKFHGLVFPLTADVPVMNLGSSKKNLDLARQMGLVSVLPDQFTVPGFLQALKQVESVEYATSVAETQRLAREAVLNAFAAPGLWQ